MSCFREKAATPKYYPLWRRLNAYDVQTSKAQNNAHRSYWAFTLTESRPSCQVGGNGRGIVRELRVSIWMLGAPKRWQQKGTKDWTCCWIYRCLFLWQPHSWCLLISKIRKLTWKNAKNNRRQHQRCTMMYQRKRFNTGASKHIRNRPTSIYQCLKLNGDQSHPSSFKNPHLFRLFALCPSNASTPYYHFLPRFK